MVWCLIIITHNHHPLRCDRGSLQGVHVAKRHDHGLPPNTASRQKLGGPASEKLYFRLLRVQLRWRKWHMGPGACDNKRFDYTSGNRHILTAQIFWLWLILLWFIATWSLWPPGASWWHLQPAVVITVAAFYLTQLLQKLTSDTGYNPFMNLVSWFYKFPLCHVFGIWIA